MELVGIARSANKWLIRADNIWQVLCVLASLLCLILMLGEVILRYVLQMPLMAIEEITCMIAFWAYFSGAVHGTFEKSHVEAEISQAFIKDPFILEIVNVLKSFFTFAISAYLNTWAIKYFIWGIQKKEVSAYLFIPSIYSQGAISVGLMLMSIYFFSHFVIDFREITGKIVRNKMR